MANWKQLVDQLKRSVSPGSVTTYAQASLWGYGTPNRNQPVGSLLRGARNNGHGQLTNRVVGIDGTLAQLPDGTDQQKQQLLREDVPFTAAGRVDFDRIDPVELT